jgi:hypothetical protein
MDILIVFPSDGESQISIFVVFPSDGESQSSIFVVFPSDGESQISIFVVYREMGSHASACLLCIVRWVVTNEHICCILHNR